MKITLQLALQTNEINLKGSVKPNSFLKTPHGYLFWSFPVFVHSITEMF